MFLNAVLFPDQVLILEALLVLGVSSGASRAVWRASFFFVSVLVPPLLLGLFLAPCGPGGFLRLQALLIGQEVFCLLRGLPLRDPFLLEALRALFGSFSAAFSFCSRFFSAASACQLARVLVSLIFELALLLMIS